MLMTGGIIFAAVLFWLSALIFRRSLKAASAELTHRAALKIGNNLFCPPTAGSIKEDQIRPGTKVANDLSVVSCLAKGRCSNELALCL
jgi:hypothetical protein